MKAQNRERTIRLAIAGIGNCASSLIEGIEYYRRDPVISQGLLFPLLGGYSVRDIEVVAAFDISSRKVGKPLHEAIYQAPNNFVRIPGIRTDNTVIVRRGPTLDGNPAHLAIFADESGEPVVDVPYVLKEARADVLVNLLPTGSIQASEFYMQAAVQAGCAFVNCIPTVLAQRFENQALFSEKNLPLLGDDIKSQLGTTILHRSLLQMLKRRGAHLVKTSQVNIGGNTDFANFVYRAETKLVSKRKSLAAYIDSSEFHVGHHYDVTKGPLKNAYIDIESTVFGGSPVKISVKLESDDKPNSAGSIADLVRLAKAARDERMGGILPEVCAFYFKSPPVEMEEAEALAYISEKWGYQEIAPQGADLPL